MANEIFEDYFPETDEVEMGLIEGDILTSSEKPEPKEAYSGRKQLASNRWLFSGEEFKDIKGATVPSGFLRVLSVKKPHKASQKNYQLCLSTEDGNTHFAVVGSSDIYKYFSIRQDTHIALSGVYTSLIQNLARKYRKEVDPSIDWDKLFKASARKVLNAYNMTWLDNDEKEDLISDTVMEVVNDRTMEQFGETGQQDPIYYFLAMFQNRLKSNLIEYINYHKKITDFGHDEEGEEFIPESESNTMRRLDEEKSKQRIPEEEYFKKIDEAEGSKKFEYILEDFKDSLYNVPGANYMLAILDGREKGLNFEQIGANMKPKPISGVSVSKYAKRLADHFLEYARLIEDEWLTQLALNYRNRMYKQSSLAFFTEASEEQLDNNEVEKTQKELDSFLKELEEGVDNVDMIQVVTNSPAPLEENLETLGFTNTEAKEFTKLVNSSRNREAVDEKDINDIMVAALLQGITSYLETQESGSELSKIFLDIYAGKSLVDLAGKYKDIDGLLFKLVNAVKEYAKNSGDTELNNLARKIDEDIARAKTSSYYSADTEMVEAEQQHSALTNFLESVQDNISKVDLKKVVKKIQRPAAGLLGLVGFSGGSLDAFNTLMNIFTGKKHNAKKEIKRCSLEGFLDENTLVDASFETDQSIEEKKVLDQQVYEAMVSEYDDIIEEGASLYGLKSTSNTAQVAPDALPKNVDFHEKIKVEKSPLINLDGEPYASSKKSTDFTYEAEDDSQIDKWF